MPGMFTSDEVQRVRGYDWVVVNSSGGKDSQAMLDYVVRLCDHAGVSRSRIVVAHADLGRVEWKGTRELAAEQAGHYRLRFEVVERSQDLLDHVRQVGRWPSSTTRYCTSDHKRDQVAKLLTRLADEHRDATGLPHCQILQCMGIRAQESSTRAKIPPFRNDARTSNGRKTVDVWLPIHALAVDAVWAIIRASGVRHHPAYDLGMPRLSCCFCIFAPKAALLLAGKHNPELLDEYVRVEREIGHTFRHRFRIAEVKAALDAGAQPGPIQDWTM